MCPMHILFFLQITGQKHVHAQMHTCPSSLEPAFHEKPLVRSPVSSQTGPAESCAHLSQAEITCLYMHVYTQIHIHICMHVHTHTYTHTQTRQFSECCRNEGHNPLQLGSRAPFDLGAGHRFPLLRADSELSIEREGQRNREEILKRQIVTCPMELGNQTHF